MDEEFEQLRREFYAALKDRAEVIAGLLAKIPSTGNVVVRGDHWTEVLYIAHKTAGLAATYDLSALTDLTAAIDDGMQNHMDRGSLQVDAVTFRSWCQILEKALRLGAEGRDAQGLPIPVIQ
jgi:hypothetical protein